MADNFDMKQFLMENKLGAYSRLKENEEQLNEYEVTYEYGSDGGCYRVDDEGNYDEVDDSMCKKYAGQGVREEKEETKEEFNPIKKIKDFAGEKGWTFSSRRPTSEEDKIAQEYMQSQGKKVGSIGVDRITGNINVMEPNGDFRAILSSEGEELSAWEMDIHETLAKEDIGGDIGDIEAAKQMDFLAEKDKVKEALSPEAFERMDAIASNTAQIAMIKAAEIMMNQLTEEGFEVLDIREYFTQLIANDI